MPGEYSYPMTDFRSGKSVSEHLPLTDVTWNDSLNNGGGLTAKVPVGHPAFSPNIKDDFKTRVIWVVRDGQPVFAGMFTGSPPDKFSSPTMSVVCKRVDAILDERPIENDLVYTQVDQFNIARDLITYGLGGGTIYTDTLIPPNPLWSAGAGMPWVHFHGDGSDSVSGAGGLSGVKRDITKVVDGQDDDGFRYKAWKSVGAALKNLAARKDGFEYRLDCGIERTGAELGPPYFFNAGQLYVRISFGYPTLGRSADDAARMSWEFPGNIVDGTWGADGTDMVTRAVIAGGDVAGLQRYGTQTNTDALARGVPYCAVVKSETTVTDQGTLDGKAYALMNTGAVVQEGFSVELDGSAAPVFGSYALGDRVLLRIDRNGTLIEKAVRVVGWTVKPNNGGYGERVTPVLAEVA